MPASALLEAGKCQLRRGERKRAHGLLTSATLLFAGVGTDGGAASPEETRVGTSKEVDGVDDTTELQELVVKSDRLAGAAALQGRDVDVGEKLLLRALVSARRLHFKAEEARCLRLLANLQKGEPRPKSLQAAVDGFNVCNLPYEHSEALLCLATLKTTKCGNGTVTDEGSFRVLPSGDMRREFIIYAKQDLEAAASLLQPTLATKDSKHDLRDAKHAQSRSATPDTVATKRPRARLCVEECGTLCKSSIALELLGRIHKACAPACTLIGEFEDARTYVTHALKNREWVGACKSEVTLARALLDRVARRSGLLMEGTCNTENSSFLRAKGIKKSFVSLSCYQNKRQEILALKRSCKPGESVFLHLRNEHIYYTLQNVEGAFCPSVVSQQSAVPPWNQVAQHEYKFAMTTFSLAPPLTRVNLRLQITFQN